MSILIATFVLFFGYPGEGDSARVSIGLFSLFKPRAVDLKVESGSAARLKIDGSITGDRIVPGDLVSTRRVGPRVETRVLDDRGRIKLTLSANTVELVPDETAGVRLSLPNRLERTVQGEVIISTDERRPAGPLRIVVRTPLESAVASVASAELSGGSAPGAVRAIAVLARTYLVFHKGRHADEGFDLCDTTHCQVFRGEGESSDLIRAVQETRGQVLSFSDRPIEGYYTAVCGGLSATPETVWGGRTRSGYPYRPIVCRWCLNSRHSRWQRSAAVTAVFNALGSAFGLRLSQAASVTAASAGPTEPVRSIVISDRGRRTRVGVDDFRRAIGRRLGWNTVLSPTFQMTRRGSAFVFEGRGFGSQVGLCVAGAVAQAAAGRDYREILSFYYPQAGIRSHLPNE